MRWRGRRQSTNIRDVRSSGGGFGGGFGRSGGGFGGGGPVVRRAGGGGIGMIIILVIIAFVFGINPLELLTGNTGQAPTQAPPGETGLQGGQDDEMGEFVATVLADTEDTWTAIFQADGQDYPEPTLTLFRGVDQFRLRHGELRVAGRSIAPSTRTSTSTSASTMSCATASARPAISPRPT